MIGNEYERIRKLMRHYEMLAQEGSGAYVSIKFATSAWTWGDITFATDWKRFHGEISFSNLDEAIEQLEDLVKRFDKVNDI